MSALSSSHIASSNIVADASVDIDNAQSASFSAGTRSGAWFAMGDAHPEMALPSLQPPPSSNAVRGSEARRSTARLVAWVVMAGMSACLVVFGARKSVRRALLEWGSFGHGDRISSIGSR
jgi:hypothetical protein